MNAHPTLTQALGSSGGIAMSDQELFLQRGAGLVSTADVSLYDGVSVTSVVNRQNPQQDAPAFTLHSGIAHSLLTVYENHPQDSRINDPLDVNPTVDARYGTGGGNVPLVAQSSWWDGGQVASSIATRSHDQNMPDKDNFGAVIHKTAVRRLLPVECERLQGFPDGWTDIPYRGKPNSPDGQRYKAIGNSMATNVMGWIGRRIQMVDEI